MKWRLRRMADKFALFLVSIKPIRWFFDQLIQFGKWAESQLWLAHIWEWYCKLVKPAWIGFMSCQALYDAWHHDLLSMSINIICILIWIFLPDRDDPDEDDEDGPDDPDPTPNGDAIDRWLKEQQKTIV